MTVRACPEIVASRPHLVLPNVRDNNGLSIRFLAYRFQDGDGVGILLVALHTCKTLVVLSLPGPKFTNPGAVIARCNRFGERGQGCLRIGYNRHGSGFDLVHLRWVDIDVDEACMGSKFTCLACNAVIEAQPDANQQVGGADRAVDMRRAMHAGHTKRQSMCLRKRAQAEQGGNDRNVCFLCKSTQFIVSVG